MSLVHRAAVFLDRDGTLIHDAHYLRDPALVRLIDGVPSSLRRLCAAGYRLIVVTNQSGIARGLISETDYQSVEAKLDALLAAEGVTLDATYHCPHEPSISGPCECRKPGTLLYRQANERFDLDPSESVFIGDRWRDIAASLALGGRGILVPSVDTPREDRERASSEAHVASTFAAAVTLVLGASEA